MTPTLSPDQAWQPLPAGQWTPDHARHLLRRAGWTATPPEVERATKDGLSATLTRLFPPNPPPFTPPPLLADGMRRVQELRQRAREAPDVEQRRQFERDARELQAQYRNELAIRWLQQAARPEVSASEKWILFLSNTYVTATDKVENPGLIFLHWAVLRQGSAGTAPALTKAVSRSPAMLIYLDLQGSQLKSPNENFARELMELFTLGEGHYTEADIKEAARAFTGYRHTDGEFRFVRRQHDATPKTIFGQTGRYDGDDVIDLIYRQPAAATFLPCEMAKFYLTEQPIDTAYFEPLGAWWRTTDFNLQKLCHRFFGSQVFYHAQFRANYIKSPVQYYLGLLQDLQLDVTPFPRTTLIPLRQMGQMIFNPPNVRGWVGGRTWINASTLAARRQLAATLFTPFNEAKLNADDKVALEIARTSGAKKFAVDDERLREFSTLGADRIVERFVDYFLPVPVNADYRAALREFLQGDAPAGKEKLNLGRVRQAAIVVLQTPEYQLC
ncbi:DUF1800 domain-containing protein [Opitutaceae bacterium TAV4]|uniref:DUF1800 domain-containing protein n=1 Tax=Geminisphaera colitermitum TaxID=1148786 RepID=UPI000158CDDE|nr:DUF1800 domain-containing protein [Geminisphaera colitermitum]RRJ97319.1 DUF1800 domain-containing protein [Opitutaceae bacterium TAV4]RRJ99246.1 DUF1800 domain-containing protein [Opitutaceae bacterium TAV3]